MSRVEFFLFFHLNNLRWHLIHVFIILKLLKNIFYSFYHKKVIRVSTLSPTLHFPR